MLEVFLEKLVFCYRWLFSGLILFLIYFELWLCGTKIPFFLLSWTHHVISNHLPHLVALSFLPCWCSVVCVLRKIAVWYGTCLAYLVIHVHDMDALINACFSVGQWRNIIHSKTLFSFLIWYFVLLQMHNKEACPIACTHVSIVPINKLKMIIILRDVWREILLKHFYCIWCVQ